MNKSWVSKKSCTIHKHATNRLWKCSKQVINNSWINHEEVVSSDLKSWTSHEQIVKMYDQVMKRSEQVINKSWTSHKQVMSNTRLYFFYFNKSPEHVMNKRWTSDKQVMNKWRTSDEQDMQKRWPSSSNKRNQLIKVNNSKWSTLNLQVQVR